MYVVCKTKTNILKLRFFFYMETVSITTTGCPLQCLLISSKMYSDEKIDLLDENVNNSIQEQHKYTNIFCIYTFFIEYPNLVLYAVNKQISECTVFC